MATMRPVLRRFDFNSIIMLLAGVLCGVAIMTGVTLVHPLKQQKSNPIVVVTSTGNSDGVTGGRLGGINSSDTANDAAIRGELRSAAASRATDRGPGTASGTLSGAAGANFVLPGDVDGGTYSESIAAPSAAVDGGRLGGIQSADTPNDAAIKNAIGTSIQDVQSDESVAGQRDVNAEAQSGQTDTYPIFRPGHAW